MPPLGIKLNKLLEDLVLMTLSFYEPMTISNIILDFDDDKLKAFPDFDKNQLQEILHALAAKKLIRPVKIDKEEGWIRIHPTRSWWKRLLSFR